MRGSDRLLAVSAALMVFFFLLLLWAGTVGAATTATPPVSEAAQDRAGGGGGGGRRSLLSRRRLYPPCHFSPLCSCSNNGPDLGLVFCEHVPLVQVPPAINSTKVFALTLSHNDLDELGDDQFYTARLWRLAVRDNELRQLGERTFSGLERSLWQLDLSGNQLSRVPHQALRRLASLRLLDLSDNQISVLHRSELTEMEDRLETLLLANNFIRQLPDNLVNGLSTLRQLDLSYNLLSQLPAGCLDGAPRLDQLNLGHNMLEAVPYAAVAGTAVRTLLLAGNNINDTADTDGAQLSLRLLDLSENQLTTLGAEAWRGFSQLEQLHLQANPLEEVEEDTFAGAPAIQQLLMHDCGLRRLENDTLQPLAGSLQVLDLGYNQLTTFPWQSLRDMSQLQSLALNDNPLPDAPADLLNTLPSLRRLNLLGDKMGGMNVSGLDVQLESAGLSVLEGGELSQQLTQGIGRTVSQLYLTKNRLKSIADDAFSRCPILKHLDLSHNQIDRLAAESFRKLGPNLETLMVFDGYAGSSFPSAPLQYLTSLKRLEFSGNHISQLSVDAFTTMRELHEIIMEHNEISSLPSETFAEDHTRSLETIRMAFNRISMVAQNTFHRLHALESIDLCDNAITALAAGAFSQLEKVRVILLDNNQINSLPDRAFSSLPRATRISLAYNRLTQLNLDAFDQVGTLASLQLDCSYNNIVELDMNKEYWTSFTSFEFVDLSHNKINRMAGKFFETMRSSLTQVSLAHNNITTISRDVFGFMPYIQLIDLSHNGISTIDYDAFHSTANLQLFNVSHNLLTELPVELFQNLVNFHILDVSYNQLKTLPDNLLRRTSIQILSAAHNNLTLFPGDCLSRVGETLRHLDLSHNKITVLSDDLLHRLNGLRRLDLSHNQLLAVQAGAFRSMRALRRLDLSHNPLGDLSAAAGLRDLHQLRHLRLVNTSLTRFPALAVHTLELVDVSDNEISGLAAATLANLTQLRSLRLDGNSLKEVDDDAWSMLSDLRQLALARNPLRNVSQLSLQSLQQLQMLDLTGVDTTLIQPSLLRPLESLTELRLTARGAEDPAGGVAALLRVRPSLRRLQLQLNTSLGSQLHGQLPPLLCNVSLTGASADAVDADALKAFRCHHLHLSVHGVPAEFRLPEALFGALAAPVRYVALQLEGAIQVGRPYTTSYPGEPGSVYLSQLQLSGGGWRCDCSDFGVGWVERWLSVWRHHFCADATSAEPRCRRTVAQLRRARCDSDQSLMTALSTDLQCKASAGRFSRSALVVTSAALLVLATSAIYSLPAL